MRSSDGRRREAEGDAAARDVDVDERRRRGRPRGRIGRRQHAERHRSLDPVGGRAGSSAGPLSRQPAGPRVGAGVRVGEGRRGRGPRVVRDRGSLRPVVRAARSGRACRSGGPVRGRPAGGRASAGTAGSSRRPGRAVSSSAAVSRSRASSRVRPQAMILASIGSKRPPTSVPGLDPGIDPDPVAGRPAEPPRRDRSPAGTRPRRPRRRGGPRPRARRWSRRACSKPSGSPAAIRSWSATRSRPVTSSVTGCSTWRRVFISRNAGSPRSSTRNSQVPALDVADRARQRQGRLAEPRAEGVIDGRRRRLLEHLLVAALDRAVALAEVDAVPVGIEEDLDLDVAAALDQPLEDQPVVAERRRRLAPRRRERIGQGAPDRGRSASPCRRHRPTA